MLRLSFLLLGLALLSLPLSSQSLDDGWADQFRSPGLPGAVTDITDDGLGNVYVKLGATSSGVVASYHWDGTEWLYFGIPADTVEVNREQMVISSSYSHLNMDFNAGEILAVAQTTDGSRQGYALQFDAQNEKWTTFNPLWKGGNISIPVKAMDGSYYAVQTEGSYGSYVSTLFKTTDDRWEPVVSGLKGSLSLIKGEIGDQIFLLRHGMNNSERWDSISWWKGSAIHSLPFHKNNLRIVSLLVHNESLYGLREFRVAADTIGHQRTADGQIIQLVDTGWSSVSQRLGEDYQVWGHNIPTLQSFCFDDEDRVCVATSKGTMRWNRDAWEPLNSAYVPSGLYADSQGRVLGYGGSSTINPLLTQANIVAYDLSQNTWQGLYAEDKEHRGFLGSYDTIMSLANDGLYVGKGSAMGENGLVSGDMLYLRDGFWNGVSGLNNRYNGTNGILTEIHRIVPHPERGIYVAGQFDSADGQRATGLALWTGEAWQTLSDSIPFYNEWTRLRDHRKNISIHDGDVYAAGTIGTSNGFRKIIAQWNEEEWKIVSEHNDTTEVNVHAMILNDEAFYLGSFSTIIERKDGAWREMFDFAQFVRYGAVRPGIGWRGSVESLELDGKDLYVGGLFDSIAAITAHNIAQWDGQNWTNLDSGLTSTNRPLHATGVYDIAMSKDQIFVAGLFNGAGSWDENSPRWVDLGDGIAFWDKKEKTWNSFGTGLASVLQDYPVAQGIAVSSDTVWVVGQFTHAGGKPSHGFAQYIIPAAAIAMPEVPNELDFGHVQLGDTLTAYLSITNPSTSTRTMRGEVTDFNNPFSINFDGIFQGSSGQTTRIPIQFTPSGIGQFEDTIVILHNSDRGEEVKVVLKGNSSTLSVAGEEGEVMNEALQVYPNPVSQKTTITLRLPTSGHARLAVYDLKGQELHLLLDEPLDLGEHSIEWEAKDLPSGTYLCRLQYNGGEMQKQIVLRR